MSLHDWTTALVLYNLRRLVRDLDVLGPFRDAVLYLNCPFCGGTGRCDFNNVL